MMSPIGDMTSLSDFFDVSVFFLSSLVTDPSFTSISWLVLELWQFLFVKNWSEVRKSLPNIWKAEQWEIPNLARISLIKRYWMLQKCQGYSSYCFWVIKKKATVKLPPPQTRLGLNESKLHLNNYGNIAFVKKHY